MRKSVLDEAVGPPPRCTGSAKMVLIFIISMLTVSHTAFVALSPMNGDVPLAGDSQDGLHTAETASPALPSPLALAASSHGTIRINNNAELLAKAAAEGWPGTGTGADPIIIQGLTIDGKKLGSGIFIGNTTLFYAIRGCQLFNCNYGSYALGAGIQLQNSPNGTIQNNYVWNCYYGVYLQTHSNDATIEHNDLQHNSYGIYIHSSDRPLVRFNNCSHSDNYGIYIYISNAVQITQNDCSFCSQGIYVYNSDRSFINDNDAVRCSGTGINLRYLTHSQVHDNDVSMAQTYGIQLSYSRWDDLARNRMEKGSLYLTGSLIQMNTHNISVDNTVNGKKVYYLKDANRNGMATPTDAGQFILVNVSYCSITNAILSNTTYPLLMYFCEHASITGCSIRYASYGIYGYFSDWATIDHNSILNSGTYGIYMDNCEDGDIAHNDISDGNMGMVASSSQRLDIVGNDLHSNSQYGIYLSYDKQFRLYGNSMSRNGLWMEGDEDTFVDMEIASNNTLNAAPVYYYKGGSQGNASVPLDAGQVIVGGASYLTIADLDISNVTGPVIIGYSNNVTVTSCALRYDRYAIDLYYSKDCQISDCDLSSSDYAVYLTSSDGNRIQDVKVQESDIPIYLYYSAGNLVQGCNLTNLDWGYGLQLYNSDNNVLRDNYIDCQGEGILLSESSKNLLHGNDIRGSQWSGGIRVNGYANILTENRLLRSGIFLGNDLESYSSQQIPMNNTVNGRPIYYAANADLSMTIAPSGLGQVICGNVSGLTIEGQRFENMSYPVLIGYGAGIKVLDCFFGNNTYGPGFYHSQGLDIAGNRFYQNYYGIYGEYSTFSYSDNVHTYDSYGVYCYSCHDVLFQGNDFLEGEYAITLQYTRDCNLTGNAVELASLRLFGDRATFTTQRISTDNTVNGKPVRYYANVDLDDAAVPTDTGQLILGNASNVRIVGMDMQNGSIGVLAGYSSGVQVSESYFANMVYGVYFEQTDYNEISSNQFKRCTYGLYLYQSNGNLIHGNIMSPIWSYGLYMYSSDMNSVQGNNFSNGYMGVYVYSSLNSSFTGNSFYKDTYGIYGYYSDLMAVVGNQFITGSRGIFISTGVDSWEVSGNRFERSSYFAIDSYGTDSCIFHDNQFVRNNGATGVYSPSHIQAEDTTGLNRWYTSAGVGNSWTDWLYPDADHNGIVDAPYSLAGGVAIDLFPLADATPPQVQVNSPGPGEVVLADYALVTWSASDLDSGIHHYEVRVDAGAWSDVGAETSYNLTGMVGQHTITVKAVDKALNPAEASVTFSIVKLPGAPTNLVASSGASYVALSWAPAEENGGAILRYEVYRATSSGGFGPVPMANVDQTSYNDASVTPGAKYFYVVKAVNARGASESSNEVNITFGQGGTPPDAPTGLTANTGPSYVSLAWSAPLNTGGGTIASYKVYRTTLAGVYTDPAIATVEASATEYLDKNMPYGTYHYKVTAVTTMEGPGSNEVGASAGVHVGAPGAITQMTLSPYKDKVKLGWGAPSPGTTPITLYYIFRSEDPSTPTLLATTPGTSYDDTSVQEGKTYYYWFAAGNTAGVGPLSAEVSATASDQGGYLVAVLLVVAIVVGALLVGLLFLMRGRKKPSSRPQEGFYKPASPAPPSDKPPQPVPVPIPSPKPTPSPEPQPKEDDWKPLPEEPEGPPQPTPRKK